MNAVLFDLDGVLIDSSRIATDRLTSAAEKHGVKLTPDEVRSLNGASSVQFWSYVKEAYSLPGPLSQYRKSYDVSAEVAKYTPKLVAPGVEDLIDGLRGQAIRLAVVTSAASWRAQRAVELLRNSDEIERLISADDIEAHKPDPAPYLTAAEHLGVAPSTCLVIEDSWRGVQAAISADMPAVAYVGFGHDEEAADLATGLIHDFRNESADTLLTIHQRARRASGDVV